MTKIDHQILKDIMDAINGSYIKTKTSNVVDLFDGGIWDIRNVSVGIKHYQIMKNRRLGVIKIYGTNKSFKSPIPLWQISKNCSEYKTLNKVF